METISPECHQQLKENRGRRGSLPPMPANSENRSIWQTLKKKVKITFSGSDSKISNKQQESRDDANLSHFSSQRKISKNQRNRLAEEGM